MLSQAKVCVEALESRRIRSKGGYGDIWGIKADTWACGWGFEIQDFDLGVSD